MSEKILRTTAAVLLTVSIILCLITSSLFNDQQEKDTYLSKGYIHWTIDPIKTERNGNVLVNDAETEELMQLYGIGETLSELIVDERIRNGPFFYAEDLTAVKGIGPRTLDQFRKMIDLSQKGRE